jgi:superfamily II DNA/RNA helicase
LCLPRQSLRNATDSGAPVVVATPARLLEELFAFSSGRWRTHSYPTAVHGVRTVVVDEADMLLTGGFEQPLKRIVQLFDRAETALAQGLIPAGPAPEIEHPEQQGTSAWDMREAQEEAPDQQQQQPQRQRQQQQQQDEEAASTVAAEVAPSQDAGGAATSSAAPSLPPRQYVFAAATIHSSGKRTPGETLRLGFPDAVWVAGPRLHRSAAQLRHAWQEVTPDSRGDAVAAALRAAPAGARTLVFANTVAAAAALTAELSGAGARAAAYHSGMGQLERFAALAAFRAGDSDVLVCTDAAARGLDVPAVAHVVQAEFALSAVDYLHRAGRTARAGAPGLLTSLYDADAGPLVAAVRTAVDGGEAVEEAFSRKRSFSKKLKKYGETRRGVSDPQKAEASAAAAARRSARR